MKTRHLVMTAGLAVAAWLALFGDKRPASGIAEPVARAPAPQISAGKPAGVSALSSTSKAEKNIQEPDILILQPREALIGGVKVAAIAPDASEGLFGTQSWTPPPPPPPKPTPPPPPTAPPMPFTYLGKKAEDGGWEVYIARGDQTYIVHDKTKIDDMYQVESIRPPLLTLIYLPMKQTQTLNIGVSN